MPRTITEKMPRGMDKTDQENMIRKDTTRLTQMWSLRDLQLQLDRDIINLVPSERDIKGKRHITNTPKVFFDTSRSLVSMYPPRFRLPIPMNYDAEQKDKMNKAERLCIGIFRSLDNQIADTGGTTWLYELAYWLLGGWYAIFNLVQKGEDGPEFTADIWDPTNVYPEWDKKGLAKCVRAYLIDQSTAQEMALDFQNKGLKFEYKIPAEGEAYSVTNYWCRINKKIYNAILLNGSLVKPLTLQKNLDVIPIRVGVVGIPDRISANWQSRKGESIIASARSEYDFKTELRTLRAEVISETTYPNMVTKTQTGLAPVKGEDIHGHGTVIPLKLQDSIELLKHAATPQDVNILDSQVQADIQQANLPSVVYGGVPVELSGFAISQLMAAIKYKLGPYLNAMQYAVGRVMTDLLYQYRKGNFDKITLSTLNPYDMKRGMTYLEEFSRDDVPERIYVEATIPISSQFDKTQAILNSVQALQSGLLSRETLWENELEVQDAEQEKQRITEDQVANDPFIRQIEIIMRMHERVEVYKVAGMFAEAAALERYIAMLETQAGITRPNTGTPANPPGIPPQQRPVEATPQSPDIANAAVGKPPPSPNRPKKGILVTPSGQSLM